MLPLAFTVLLTVQAPAFLHQNPTTDQTIRYAIQATYNLNLPEARRAASALQSQYPDHPIGYTLMAQTYFWEAWMDGGNKAVQEDYFKAQRVAVDKGEEALMLGKYKSIEVTETLAAAHGGYALFEAFQREAYLSALKAGLKAKTYSDQAYKIDPNSYDSWVGIGAFNYFTGSAPAVLKPFLWMMGARGNAKLGLKQLQTASELGRYAKTDARLIYCAALMEGRQYSASLVALESLLAAYPNNFVMYSWIATWHKMQKKHSEGEEYFEKLYRTQVAHSPSMAQYALLEKAQLQQSRKHTAEARETVERLKAVQPMDSLLTKKIQALEMELK